MTKATILVVEDERIVAMDIQSSLEHIDYSVAANSDRGEDAVQKAREFRPDIILMDINLKGQMDGIEAATQIRAELDIPVIFLTAYADGPTIERARLAEPFGYILKPYDERDLSIAIEMALYKHSMERKLRESENKFHNVVENASDGIALMDKQGMIIEWNAAMERITGLKRSDVIGKAIWDVTIQLLPDEKKTNHATAFITAQWKAEVQNRYKNKEQMKEREIQHANGRLRIIESSGFTVETAQGILGGVIMRDITENRRIEKDLLESKERLQTVTENASAFLVELDIKGTILYMSRVLPGYTMEEVIGKHIRDWTAPDYRTILDEKLARVLETGSTQMYESYGAGTPGEMRWYLTTLTPVKTENEMNRIVLVATDITERKALEESERDQRQLAESLRDTAMALNSTLNLDDVLDRILINIEKLVQSDVAMVSLIEGESVRNIRHQSNHEKNANRISLGDLHANLLNVPVLKQIIKTKQPVIIPDIQNDQRWKAIAIPGMQKIRSFICAPIEIHDQVSGVINVLSGVPNQFHSTHLERIMAFASQAAVAIDNASLYEKAKRLSTIDPLTSLFNMRYFRDFAQLEFERCQRYGRTLSVAMLDIDHFKSINDTFGHATGDLVLAKIADMIRKSVRSVDVVARYGGEEFVILMPETNLEDALQVAERVQQVIRNESSNTGSIPKQVTISIGLAEKFESAHHLDDLVKQADKALYKAKGNGRNRVETADR